MADRSIGFDIPPLKSSRPGESSIRDRFEHRAESSHVHARRHVQVQAKCVAIRSAGTSIEDQVVQVREHFIGRQGREGGGRTEKKIPSSSSHQKPLGTPISTSIEMIRKQ